MEAGSGGLGGGIKGHFLLVGCWRAHGDDSKEAPSPS